MKKILKTIIIFLIQIIEKIQYHSFPDDELNKFVDIIPISDIEISTDYGFVPIEEINVTKPLQRYELILENAFTKEITNSLIAADNHLVFCTHHKVKCIKDLDENDFVITDGGLRKVHSVKKVYGKTAMFDLSINTPEESYFINGLLSHNTVSAAIVLLHFILFNNDKNCMIVANKSKTVVEILSKIKSIYVPLPFFLKRGAIAWNQSSITLDNGSNIQTEKRTKEPAIGFTIDFLYFDEFAKVPRNIIEPYYTSAVPTISAMENSKIVITSTPDGYNLFHKILTDSERADDDPLKNRQFKSKRVYWWEVEGRRDTMLYPTPFKFDKYGFTIDVVIESLKDLGYQIYSKKHNDQVPFFIKFDKDFDETHIEHIKTLRYNNIPLIELFLITNWKEEQTELLGGDENKFKQEFDIQFITEDKLLFENHLIEFIKQSSQPFEYVQIPKFETKMMLPYTGLKFIKDKPELFLLEKAKDYYIFAGVDLAEGLGKDFTVLNLFRLLPKIKK
jgi:hypothetical protein